jgi:CRISPR system Cascade subunit CasA
MDHNLLSEALLTWRDAQRRMHQATLPEVLARLASSELADFPCVRTHQLEPWCMFLTQLAALALHRAGQTYAAVSAEQWRGLLLALTEHAEAPWCLVVDDLSLPAFFQPPVPEGTVDACKVCQRPDDIDVLVTAKAHDVKTGLIKDNTEVAKRDAHGALSILRQQAAILYQH